MGGGSSPRSWGTLFSRIQPGLHRRFIPTLVGNTHGEYVAMGQRKVHPHARGEHDPHQHLARGAVRFIPTLVGNTSERIAKKEGVLVHPHARGEHSKRAAKMAPYGGSSPRSWGTLYL